MPAAPTSAETEATFSVEPCVFRRFFEEAPVAMAIAGPDRRFVKVNQAFCQMLGYEEHEMVGRTYADFTYRDDLPDSDEHARRLYEGVAAKDRYRKRYVHKNGGIRWAQVTLTLMREQHGRPTYALAVVEDITERKRAEEERRASEVRYRALAARLLTVQDEERRSLARELHDETGQTLTSLLVGLRTIQEAQTIWEARSLAEHLRRIASEAVDDLGRIARGLHPSVLDDHGLEAALRRLAGDVAELHRISIVVEDPCLGRRFPPHVETTLYRITQEALANAVRHARAQHVLVSVQCGDGEIVLRVRDDGPGLDPANPGTDGHLGLLGMRERAALASGTVVIESRPGEGTTVVARLPLVAT